MSRGPQPYKQRHTRTLFVRVPSIDWPLVTRGHKTEFRGQIGQQSALWNVVTPSPVVAYTVIRGSYNSRLMLLERCWQEELAAISDESLEREGFEEFAEFRRYWIRREASGKKFQPTKTVFVYRVRPWQPDDLALTAEVLIRRLYGEFLP